MSRAAASSTVTARWKSLPFGAPLVFEVLRHQPDALESAAAARRRAGARRMALDCGDVRLGVPTHTVRLSLRGSAV
jgi:hypothetical protein